MANTDNLMSPEELNARLTPEQRKANASKAGKASGEARREKKLIRERILERMTENDWDEYIDGIIRRAKEGDRSAEMLRDTIGEKPVEQVNIMNVDKSLEKMEEFFNSEG